MASAPRASRRSASRCDDAIDASAEASSATTKISIPAHSHATGYTSPKSSISKSAPTTPGGRKKHAHFDESNLESQYSLQRTSTAPSSFESTPSLLLPEVLDFQETEDPQTPVIEQTEGSDAQSSSPATDTASDDSDSIYLDTEEPAYTRRSHEEHYAALRHGIGRLAINAPNASVPGGPAQRDVRSPSAPVSRFVSPSTSKSSMSTISTTRDSFPPPRLRVSKAQAECSTSPVNVLSRVQSNPEVYCIEPESLPDETSLHGPWGLPATPGKSSSPSGNDMTQRGNVLWANDKSLGKTPVRREEAYTRQAFPVEKVRTRLAEWALESEDSDEAIHALRPKSTRPARFPSGDEGVPAPPNTGRSSQAPSRSESMPQSSSTSPGATSPAPQGPSCGRTSSPTSPSLWLQPALVVRKSSPPATRNGTTITSNIARQLSSLPPADRFKFASRDSLDIHRQHLQEKRKDRTNALLASTQDSFLLTHRRFQKTPKPAKAVQPVFTRLMVGGLSPILDASPPDPRTGLAEAIQAGKRPSRNGSSIIPEPRVMSIPPGPAYHIQPSTEVRGHPDNDHDCLICSVERPRTVMREAQQLRA